MKLQALKNKNYSKMALLFLFICLSHISLGFDFKIIYALSIFLFLISINQFRFIYMPLVIILSVISSMYFPIAMLYGEPNFNISTALLYTNTGESIEFLSNIPYYHYLLSLFILALGIYTSKFRFNIHKKTKLTNFFIFLIIFLQGPIKTWATSDEFSILNTGLPEIKFIKQTVLSISSTINEKIKMDEMLAEKDDYPKLSSTSDYDTYIIDIGESARKSFMHSYGFEIANTPFFDNIKGKVFTNYISAASTTVPSLMNTLTEYSRPQNNVVTLANKAGFDTYWISNQGSIGIHDSPIASIGKKAKKSIFIKHGDFSSLESDAELLPYINKAIENKVTTKKLIIIHLIGSHSPACKRTNNKYDVFYLNERMSCYVQSIKETDHLLKSIYDDLNATKTKWSFMYFSDHGVSFANKENKSKTDLIHGHSHKQNFEVPFFITSYNDNDRVFINARISGLNFLSLFSEWIGINRYQIPNCKMISNQDCKFNKNILDADNKFMDFDQLPDDLLQP